MMKNEILNLLSLLLQYPDIQIKKVEFKEWDFFKKTFSNDERVNKIIKYFKDTDLIELQKQYVNLYDINPCTHLYAGYVILGDDLKRGVLLQKLKEEYNQCHIDLKNELADYIPLLIKLISKHKDEILRRELIQYLLLPALDILVNNMEASIYKDLLIILKEYLIVNVEKNTEITLKQ